MSSTNKKQMEYDGWSSGFAKVKRIKNGGEKLFKYTVLADDQYCSY